MGGEFSGALRERVTIEARSSERTATGLVSGPWETVARVFAEVRGDGEGAGAEREGMALSAMPRFRVTMRRRDDVRLDHRLRWGPRLLAIRQIIEPPAMPDRMIVRCEEWRGE